MPTGQLIVVIVGVVFCVLVFAFFARLFAVWFRAFSAGAAVSFTSLLSMTFRRSPIEKIIDLKVMAAQAGIAIPTSKLEAALFVGADIERAVLDLIRARELGQELTWEEVISRDMFEQLKSDQLPDS